MLSQFELSDYDRAADFIRDQAGSHQGRLAELDTVGLVLGSGLNALALAIGDAVVIPYESIPHFPTSTATGHEGRLLIGTLAGRIVVAMQGRFHFYEGYSAAEVTFPIRVMRRLGVDRLILTNAAGGLNPEFCAGDFMLIVDHLNFVGMAGHSPLIGPNIESFGTRFPSMTEAYAGSMRRLALETAAALKIELRQGVYAYLAGPNFESPAEIRFLRLAGADAVGMSTVPEALVGNHAGMQVLGISTITNMAIDQLDTDRDTNHEEVLETGERVVPLLTALLSGILERL